MSAATLKSDTTGMLSPLTVWPFSVTAYINSNDFYLYFLIWSLSRLLCCVCSGFNVAAPLGMAYGFVKLLNSRVM
jgi:hypothetical protein